MYMLVTESVSAPLTYHLVATTDGQTWDETNNISHPYLVWCCLSSSQLWTMGWCQVLDTGHTILVAEISHHAVLTVTLQAF